MIQRIQTVFILAAGLFTAALFVLPIADILVIDELHQFTAFGVFKAGELVYDGMPLLILIGIIAALHLVIIFSYKKRIRQIRMLVFTIILLLGLFGLLFYFVYAGFKDVQVVFKPAVAFPLVAIILDYLAIRAIGKDEALIRSMDRIR